MESAILVVRDLVLESLNQVLTNNKRKTPPRWDTSQP